MLDHISVLTKSGVVLWCKEFVRLKGNPVDSLIRNVLLEERISDKVYKQGNYTMKWQLNNQFDLIFVVVYSVQLLYIDELLDLMARAFVSLFKDRLLEKPIRLQHGFQFDSHYEEVLDRVTSANEKKTRHGRGFEEKRKEEASSSAGGESSGVESRKKNKDTVAAEEGEEERDGPSVVEKQGATPTQNSPQVDDEEQRRLIIEKKRELLLRGKGGGAKKPTSPAVVAAPAIAPSKKTRGFAASTKLTKEEQAQLDRSGSSEQDKQRAFARAGDEMGDPTAFKAEEEIDWDKLVDEEESASGPKSTASKLFGFFKTITAGKVLDESDLEAPLSGLREVLITKNVATDIADKLCDSVQQQLVGQKSEAGFGGIKKSVYKAMESALSRVLTPKQSIDVLREVLDANKQGRPYVMVFVGVNGVGKSTSLSKVCAWLMHHGKKVLIVACDTFRSGAVEQLRVHGARLKTEVFERGYDKDPASVAMEGIKHARSGGYDVVLVDTAGRMQDNEPLMRALAKLVNINTPDKVLFVGEALVGNDSVDQLTKFNQALIDHATVTNPRKIDGIILTKFDTIDDKVGAVVSMVYSTGQPVFFVGVGQTYSDIRQLNVRSICHSLLM